MEEIHNSRKISDLDLFDQVPGDDDYFPLVQGGAIKNTVRLPTGTLRDMFPSRRDAPGSATSHGEVGDVAFDDNYFYFHTGLLWNRIPRSGESDWSVDAAALQVPSQEGVYEIPSGEQVSLVSFGTPFSGSAPRINFSVEYEGSNIPNLIGGVVTGRTTDNFTITLSSPVPDTDYTIYWIARQI